MVVGAADRLALCLAVQPASACRASSRRWPACSRVLGLQLYILGSTGSINLPYGSALVNFGQIAGHAGLGRPMRWRRCPASSMFVDGLPHRCAPPGGRTCRRRRSAACRSSARRHHRRCSKSSSATSTSRSRHAVDVRPVRRPGRGHELRADPHQMGPLDDTPSAATARRRAAPASTSAASTPAPSCCARCFAALGGVLAAARLASASQQAGTGDVNLNAIAAAVIGGTSLFGGRGSAYSALLGIIVIQSIASGLTLLDLSSSLRYMITGARARHRRHRRLAGPPLARLPRPRLNRSESRGITWLRNLPERSRRSPARRRASASNAPGRCSRPAPRVVLVDRAEDSAEGALRRTRPEGHPAGGRPDRPGERRRHDAADPGEGRPARHLPRQCRLLCRRRGASTATPTPGTAC